jgi:hypothetical protein
MRRANNISTSALFRILTALALSVPAAAQVPDGWIVWGSFMSTNLGNGQCGIFFSHPRDGLQPVIQVTGLPPALAFDPLGRRGSACVAYRASDGMLIAGERSPAGTSVDLHVMRLQGSAVVFDQLFSVGTSVNVGEIPQCALLPDGRIVVGASDLQPGGPLAQFQTLQYNFEGLGIVDTISGAVTPIQVSNLSSFPGVINGLNVSHDGQTVYVGNYISASAGDLWEVPIAGGMATQVAQLPFGASNVAVDNDGTVLVTTLNGPPNLFRYDPVSGATTPITTTSGALNAVCVEPATGNLLYATASSGVPARSLMWMDSSGVETVISSPNMQTISGVSVNPNPEQYGASTPGEVDYYWQLAPNPGGLPLVGNSNFSLTVASDQPMIALVLMSVSLARTSPTLQFGLLTHIDLGVAATIFTTLVDTATMPLPLPNANAFVGIELFAQAYLSEQPTTVIAASPAVSLTIL